MRCPLERQTTCSRLLLPTFSFSFVCIFARPFLRYSGLQSVFLSLLLRTAPRRRWSPAGSVTGRLLRVQHDEPAGPVASWASGWLGELLVGDWLV